MWLLMYVCLAHVFFRTATRTWQSMAKAAIHWTITFSAETVTQSGYSPWHPHCCDHYFCTFVVLSPPTSTSTLWQLCKFVSHDILYSKLLLIGMLILVYNLVCIVWYCLYVFGSVSIIFDPQLQQYQLMMMYPLIFMQYQTVQTVSMSYTLVQDNEIPKMPQKVHNKAICRAECRTLL